MLGFNGRMARRGIITGSAHIAETGGEGRLFEPVASRQHIVGQLCGRRQKQVVDHQQFQVGIPQRLFDPSGIATPAQRIMVLDKQSLDRVGLALGNRPPQAGLMGRSRPTQQMVLAVPGRRHGCIKLFIAVAQQTKPINPQSLAPLLFGQAVHQHHIPVCHDLPGRAGQGVAALAIQVAANGHQTGNRPRRLEARRAELAHPVATIDNARPVAGKLPGDFDQKFLRDPGEFSGSLWRVGSHVLLQGLESGGVLLDKLPVVQPFFNQHRKPAQS